MRRLVNRGVQNPLTIRAASVIIGGVLRNRQAHAGAIRAWIDVKVRFQPDPYGMELLREVPEMLEDMARWGAAQVDCDDVAVLSAALGKAVGLRPRFVVLGFEGPVGWYRHVYTELSDGVAWTEIDVRRPPGGAVPTRITRMDA